MFLSQYLTTPAAPQISVEDGYFLPQKPICKWPAIASFLSPKNAKQVVGQFEYKAELCMLFHFSMQTFSRSIWIFKKKEGMKYLGYY